MPQTFYVAQDEEILSIISRLRSSALLENVFVVPKRALILQSIVNLRLLAREAEKLGKNVVIVTQDEQGRMLVEKAGLPSRAYSDDIKTREEKPQISKPSTVPQEEYEQPSFPLPDERSIGSSDFFADSKTAAEITDLPLPTQNTPAKHSGSVLHPTGNNMRLRVRDNTPKHLTAFNSMSDSTISERPRPREGFPSGNEHIRAHPPADTPISAPMRHPTPTRDDLETPSRYTPRETESRIKRLFGGHDRNYVVTDASQKSEKVKVKDVNVEKGGRKWFIFFALLSLLSIVGITLFLFMPKAEIVIVPQSSSPSVAFSVEGKVDMSNSENAITARLVEYEEEIAVSTEATGVSAEGANKARGTVILYNEYGTASQPLVATTRLETEDGKIFRLVKSVTIPGMTEINGKKEAGAIEAEVVADEAGEDYNIETATFTIPGFKGGPKYEKFSAKTKGAFTGGSNGGSDSGMRTVTASDITKAEEEAMSEFRKRFEEKLIAERGDDENFVIDSADIATVGTAAAPAVGVAAASFEYRVKYRGRIFVFSELSIKERAARMLEDKVKNQGLVPKPEHITVSYTEAVPDFDKGTVFIKTSISSKIVADIDIERLKNEFLGKRSDEIKAILDTHHEIKKIEINSKPQFFSSVIPTDRDRVSIVIQPE